MTFYWQCPLIKGSNTRIIARSFCRMIYNDCKVSQENYPRAKELYDYYLLGFAARGREATSCRANALGVCDNTFS